MRLLLEGPRGHGGGRPRAPRPARRQTPVPGPTLPPGGACEGGGRAGPRPDGGGGRARGFSLRVGGGPGGETGSASFERAPLREATDCTLSVEEGTSRYIELGKHWSAGHRNRM